MKKPKTSQAKKEIFFSREYLKSYDERIRHIPQLKSSLLQAFKLFIENRELVRDHSLKGVMQGKCAFSVTDNIRVVYRETSDKIVMLDVGTHKQVYTK